MNVCGDSIHSIKQLQYFSFHMWAQTIEIISYFTELTSNDPGRHNGPEWKHDDSSFLPMQIGAFLYIYNHLPFQKYNFLLTNMSNFMTHKYTKTISLFCDPVWRRECDVYYLFTILLFWHIIINFDNLHINRTSQKYEQGDWNVVVEPIKHTNTTTNSLYTATLKKKQNYANKRTTTQT